MKLMSSDFRITVTPSSRNRANPYIVRAWCPLCGVQFVDHAAGRRTASHADAFVSVEFSARHAPTCRVLNTCISAEDLAAARAATAATVKP